MFSHPEEIRVIRIRMPDYFPRMPDKEIPRIFLPVIMRKQTEETDESEQEDSDCRGYHRTPETAFREDESRIRKGYGSENIAGIRHLASVPCPHQILFLTYIYDSDIKIYIYILL